VSHEYTTNPAAVDASNPADTNLTAIHKPRHRHDGRYESGNRWIWLRVLY
jgi:hypothetical protein